MNMVFNDNNYCFENGYETLIKIKQLEEKHNLTDNEKKSLEKDTKMAQYLFN